MTLEEILEEKPEISVAEVIAIKKDMSVEEMVAMKNDVRFLSFFGRGFSRYILGSPLKMTLF